jgi:hypothetical protein
MQLPTGHDIHRTVLITCCKAVHGLFIARVTSARRRISRRWDHEITDLHDTYAITECPTPSSGMLMQRARRRRCNLRDKFHIAYPHERPQDRADCLSGNRPADADAIRADASFLHAKSAFGAMAARSSVTKCKWRGRDP